MRFFVRSRLTALGLLVLAGVAVAQTAGTAFFVNDLPITEPELARAHQGSPLSGLNLKGAPGQDVENLILDQAVLIAAAQQDAAKVEVDSGALADFIEKFRTDRELGNDEDYLKFLEDIGYTEGDFLEAVEKQLQLNQRINEIAASAVATNAELEFYYRLYKDNYVESGKPAFPFADLKPSVRKRLEADVRAIKQNEAIETWVIGLMQNAQVRFPEGSKLDWYNPVVASVNGLEISLGALNREVYQNPQILLFLQGGSQNAAALIGGFFKPQALSNLIDQSVALQYASHSNKAFIGSGRDVLAQVERDQIRGVRVSDAEVRAYYKRNIASYTDPATIYTSGATFKTSKDANAFRSKLLKAKDSDFERLAVRYRGVAKEYGYATIDRVSGPRKVLFDLKKLSRFGKKYVSGVLREGNKIEVFLIHWLRPQVIKPYDQVRGQVAALTLAKAQENAKKSFWVAERKKHVIVNNLEAVNKELEARAKKADAAAGTK